MEKVFAFFHFHYNPSSPAFPPKNKNNKKSKKFAKKQIILNYNFNDTFKKKSYYKIIINKKQKNLFKEVHQDDCKNRFRKKGLRSF